VIEGKPLGGGVQALFSIGVTYLLAFYSTNATLIIQDSPKTSSEVFFAAVLVYLMKGRSRLV